MANIDRDAVEAKIRAYIHPNAPQTGEQEIAFDEAVDAQLNFETAGELPAGVTALTIGSYTVRRAEPGCATPSPAGICPEAWALLFNANLLRRELPQARRL